MKKKKVRILFLVSLLIGICIFTSLWILNPGRKDFPVSLLSESDSVILKKGDILVRPNWSWLPGSCSVENGRKYGHVAIVTEGSSGKTIDEALEKASVIEALFFDQATRKFQFRKKDQIREGKASVSFGQKFKGIRYLLRMQLKNDQTDSMIKFLRNQLDGGYDILSLKKHFGSNAEKESILQNLKNANWHCATIVWNAYYLVTGIDIDANDGFLIYPSDIIECKCFDLPDGRVRF